MNALGEIRAAPRVSALREAARLPLAQRLDRGIAPRLLPVYADLRDELVAFAGPHAAAASARRHAELIARFCIEQDKRIARLESARSAFELRQASALDSAEVRAAILDFARSLGAGRRQLRHDARALDRFFDADAVLERCHKRRGERERALAYALERLGLVLGEALADDPEAAQGAFFVEVVAELLARMRQWGGDARVRRAAHACLKHAAAEVRRLPEGLWLDELVSATRRTCLDDSEDVWAQCEALDALLAVSPQSLPAVIARRLKADPAARPAAARDGELFVRRHLVRLVCRHAARRPALARFIPTLANDREGAVRQAFAEVIHHLPAERARGLLTRLRTDRDPQVRAAIFADPVRLFENVEPLTMVGHIGRIFIYERDEFVLRMALDAAAQTAAWLAQAGDGTLDEAVARLREGLEQLQQREIGAKVRRWADEARERIWLAADPDARAIAAALADVTCDQREASVRKVPLLRAWLGRGSGAAEREKVGRVMAVLAQRGFGLAMKPGRTPRVQRGEWLRRRWWRVLFEARHAATDKRQAFLHTTGRDYYGSMIAPSARMAELAPTKVPGEPLFEASEGGWRNYLPLADQVLTALDRGEALELYTSAGITAITPPRSALRRLRGFWQVTRRFAALRNRDPEAYLEQLRALGLEISFRAYRGDGDEADANAPNPEIVKLFDMGGVALALPVLWERAIAYGSTVYENNLVELAVFAALASLWFFGRHVVLGWQARRLRSGLALVLGGWGTRGKSGTERLKAGLINALGPSIVSKTTGCEAMFLTGSAFGPLTEMFLFRPYDKATIWEQFNLLKTARGLDARVFLWECMGLNPAYVRVLQRDWMRDDIGTITNTYPDHEDVQGPAGRNIPEVMCEFIPCGSHLITSEEEMLPILGEGARQAGSTMRAVGWKEAGLIHRSLLARFPYEEHPYNIALVTAMGDELGLPGDFCVKEMADRVVADLGVLKTYPRAEIDGRTLEFVMGMSANERFGAMGNWQRMGFAEHSLARDPQVFVTTVVNNRADRVPRSRVFARMLVQDISADRHFLIGSNIEGLLGFIEEEWAEYATGLTLFEEGGNAAERLEALARRQRIPVSEGELAGLLGAMLAPHADASAIDEATAQARAGRLGPCLADAGIAHGEAICAHYAANEALLREYEALAAALAAGSESREALDGRLRALLGKAFHAKLVPVRDFYIKGEAIVRLVAQHTPPGLVNRIMGMQNIKGTGLDWVYRWQAWETVYKACGQLREEDPAQVAQGYRTLATFQEFGALSEGEMRRTIAHLRRRSDLSAIISPAQIDALEARLDAQLAAARGAQQADLSAARQSGWLARSGERLLAATEAFIDASDAVRRRRAADRIYRAMTAEQISTQRAAAELKALTARQKGGWLVKSLKARGAALLDQREAA